MDNNGIASELHADFKGSFGWFVMTNSMVWTRGPRRRWLGTSDDEAFVFTLTKEATERADQIRLYQVARPGRLQCTSTTLISYAPSFT